MENGITITDNAQGERTYALIEWLWEQAHPNKCQICGKYCLGADDHAMLLFITAVKSRMQIIVKSEKRDN